MGDVGRCQRWTIATVATLLATTFSVGGDIVKVGDAGNVKVEEWQRVAARGSAWQRVAACGSVWQRVAARGSTWQRVAARGSAWQPG